MWFLPSGRPGAERKARALRARRATVSSTNIESAPRSSKTTTKTCILDPTPPHFSGFRISKCLRKKPKIDSDRSRNSKNFGKVRFSFPRTVWEPASKNPIFYTFRPFAIEATEWIEPNKTSMDAPTSDEQNDI